MSTTGDSEGGFVIAIGEILKISGLDNVTSKLKEATSKSRPKMDKRKEQEEGEVFCEHNVLT